MRSSKLLTLFTVLLILGRSTGARAQAMAIPLTISDGTPNGTTVLYFGLDPTATDGIDAALGETELPPAPPAGVFDARFIGTDIGKNFGQGLAKDYRQGTTITKVTHIHELAYQLGTGTTITIFWSLPDSVTGLLEDLFNGVLVKKTMSGKDSLQVTNPSILAKLKMMITYTGPTAVNEIATEKIPTAFALEQNYPNPFNPSTHISFSLPKPCRVTLKVFTVLGEEVVTLTDGEFSAGRYETIWDANSMNGGVYFYRLQAGSFVQTKKLILMK